MNNPVDGLQADRADAPDGSTQVRVDEHGNADDVDAAANLALLGSKAGDCEPLDVGDVSTGHGIALRWAANRPPPMVSAVPSTSTLNTVAMRVGVRGRCRARQTSLLGRPRWSGWRRPSRSRSTAFELFAVRSQDFVGQFGISLGDGAGDELRADQLAE